MKTDIEIAQETKMLRLPPLRPSMELLRTIWNLRKVQGKDLNELWQEIRTDRMENSFW